MSIVKHQKDPYKIGYNPICVIDKEFANMMLDVGVIKLEEGDSYANEEMLERAVLLIQGKVTFRWEGQEAEVERKSCFDENPILLHVPQGVKFEIIGADSSELMYEAIANDTKFDSRLFLQTDTVSDVFGKDALDNTSIRTVRTVLDDDTAPHSNLVIGEVINHPGKWSSYPPHHHVQPEVYHYRFLPEQGFGVGCVGDQAEAVFNRSTLMITPNEVHPQAAAPGYAMYYVWMIPHKPKRWLKDRNFAEEHEWMLDKNAKIWPYKD